MTAYGSICVMCGEEIISGKTKHLKIHGIPVEVRNNPHISKKYFTTNDGW